MTTEERGLWCTVHDRRGTPCPPSAPDDALSVLRDLVDLFDNVGIGVRGRKERFDHAWARARSLVAEHRANEEQP